MVKSGNVDSSCHMRDEETPQGHTSLWGPEVRAEAKSTHRKRTARDEMRRDDREREGWVCGAWGQPSDGCCGPSGGLRQACEVLHGADPGSLTDRVWCAGTA